MDGVTGGLQVVRRGVSGKMSYKCQTENTRDQGTRHKKCLVPQLHMPQSNIFGNLIDKGGSEPMSQKLIRNLKFDHATMTPPHMNMI